MATLPWYCSLNFYIIEMNRHVATLLTQIFARRGNLTGSARSLCMLELALSR